MTGTPRVLVIDDEPDIRMIVGMNLTLAGIDYAEAEDGQVAIEMLSSQEWAGCILDLAMPVADGFQVLRAMQAMQLIDKMGVLVLSANGAPTTAIEAMELGAHTHLAKPFSPAAVAEAMRELIGLTPEQRIERRSEMKERAGNLDRLGVNTV
jgi:two-component system, OmpR family, response regulator PrrA